MSHWYEVFDNEQVQLVTRKQVGLLTATVIVVAALTVAGLALGHAGILSFPALGSVFLILWLWTVRWIAVRLSRLRRVVWCIKISDRRIVGYDYTRSKTILDWVDVVRVELRDTGLMVVGPDQRSFEVSHLFPDFAELSHRIVHYAEFYDLPIFLNGQPWQSLNVYDLFPFLQEDPSSERPDALPGSLRA